jgi:hypothetical protein
MTSAKHVVWRDITIDVYQKIKSMTEEFVLAKEIDSELVFYVGKKSMEFPTLFSVNIDADGKVLYTRKCWEETEKAEGQFASELENFVRSAHIVYCQRSSLRKCDDMKPYDLMRVVNLSIDRVEWGYSVVVELFKPQTFIKTHVEYDNGKFGYHVAVYNIVDVIDGDEDMLEYALNERPPLMEDSYRTASTSRVKQSIKTIATTFETYVDIDAYVRETRRTCLMNLKTREAYGEHKGYKFPMTPESKEDRYRYGVTVVKKFHDELLQIAWHPSRHVKWCLTTDEAENVETWGRA